MIPLDSMSPVAEAPQDAELVQRCLVDGAGAFAEIVARYQTLVCSLTYNATGSLSRSEDLAQEVFLTAWRELRQLREPEKLRSWLCGIARRLSANTRRREEREPVCAAGELEDEHEAPAPGPVDAAISREEEAILWRSLERIPENYREPLILSYRQGQSVEEMAAALELTEDTAKQRLSRGRKLLQEQVALFVEGALRLSTPGRAFTLGVLAALPLMKTSATAATLGTAAAKTGATAKCVGLLGLLSALVGPALGVLGAWFGVQAGLESAGSERERALLRRQVRQVIGLVLIYLLLLGVSVPLAARVRHDHLVMAMGLLAGFIVLYTGAMVITIRRLVQERVRIRAEERPRFTPEVAARQAEAWKTFEYISPWKFLGLPLVHIRSGRPIGVKLRPAIGWIAIGDAAIGGLFALGATAIAPISIGGASVGIITAGGASLGVLALAGLAIGIYGATGSLAIGYLAHGACALGWHAAEGGLASAHDFALGGEAYAAHANDAAAQQALAALPFFGIAEAMLRNPVVFSVAYLPMLLIVWQGLRARRVLQRAA
jgi:RNA polymerase sigma factor (sigma-70 family)